MSTEEENYELYLRFGKYVVRRLDVYNIIVAEIKVRQSGDNKGEEYEVTLGYYNKIYKALEKVLKLSSTQKDIKKLEDAVKAMKDAEKNLLKVLKEEYPKLSKL